MQSITQVVQSELDTAGYGSYFRGIGEKVVGVLEDRERDIYESLLATGQNLGASESSVRSALADAGLTAPRPVAVEASISVEGRNELASIKTDLSALMQRIENALG